MQGCVGYDACELGVVVGARQRGCAGVSVCTSVCPHPRVPEEGAGRESCDDPQVTVKKLRMRIDRGQTRHVCLHVCARLCPAVCVRWGGWGTEASCLRPQPCNRPSPSRQARRSGGNNCFAQGPASRHSLNLCPEQRDRDPLPARA